MDPLSGIRSETAHEWREASTLDRHSGPTARPALLYLAHRLPYPPDKGDRIGRTTS